MGNRRSSHDRRATEIVKRFTITDGRRFRLKDVDPDDTGDFDSKEDSAGLLARSLDRMRALQEKLYAQGTDALLLIFQAMDAAGKDSTIKHVMSGVNPQGCQVWSFKAPSSDELAHDFLWRTTLRLPERGRIGIFNRSYYEEVLVVRVHPDFLNAQRLPRRVVSRHIWKERFEDISAFEQHLHRSGVVVRKFFLHISKEEQKQRFLERIERPEKNWKFSAGDVMERARWDAYMGAYEEMIRKTATPNAPWIVVPGNHKWFTRLVVSTAVADALENMDLAFPELNALQRKALKATRAALEREPKKSD